MKSKKLISVLCAVSMILAALPAASAAGPETVIPASEYEDQIKLAVKNAEMVLNTSPNRPTSKWELPKNSYANSFKAIEPLMTEYTEYYFEINKTTISCSYEVSKTGSSSGNRRMKILLYRKAKTVGSSWELVDTRETPSFYDSFSNSANFIYLDTNYYYCIGFMNSTANADSDASIIGSFTITQK